MWYIEYMRGTIRFYVLGCLGLILSLSPVLAVETSETATPTTRKSTKPVAEKMCLTAEERITAHIEKLEQGHNRRVALHKEHRDRLAALVEKLKAAGKDTTNLQADLDGWSIRIQAFEDASLAHIAALKSTQNYSCSTAQADFLVALNAARDLLPAIRTAAQDIKTWWAEEIKPDIEKFRSTDKATRKVKP